MHRKIPTHLWFESFQVIFPLILYDRRTILYLNLSVHMHAYVCAGTTVPTFNARFFVTPEKALRFSVT